ncbi:hypothetical protein GCM10028806_19230 [Spirosoma terrae]|uniref:Uncharacterized protein n=1 Tax=Spirosoma terrae TaxID=1968276 RepID=A0A6L9LD58_9BACT|nr:hypothetical protein [Spirosoma terrae]NDU94759.1 hypothetical protein [Spirosoma terrae]
MSVSSKIRKESTESYAARQMHSTMGIAPELAQLNDKNLDNELPSRVASSRDTDVPGDVAAAEARATEEDEPSAADVEEARRASWGQPALPADAENATVDKEDPMTAYQPPNQEASLLNDQEVPDADWNRSTNDAAIPATRANEPDRTLGNS